MGVDINARVYRVFNGFGKAKREVYLRVPNVSERVLRPSQS